MIILVKKRKCDMFGEVLVIGGGKFGFLAIKKLFQKIKVVVDPIPSSELLKLCQKLGVHLWREDGQRVVQAILNNAVVPRWILPCLPVHLLVEWLRLDLEVKNLKLVISPVPQEAILKLPLVVFELCKVWYLSLADSICLFNCQEPTKYCLKTGKLRGRDLYLRLADINIPNFCTAVLRSHQLLPGIGALKVKEMFILRDRLIYYGGNWLIATSCRCHGVLQAVKIIRYT